MSSRPGRLGLAGIVLLAAACTSSGAPSCDAQATTLEVTVTADSMEPSSLSVCREQDVTIGINSQADGEFHLHGYDQEVELTDGGTATLTFTADVAGQFIIELHGSSGDETEIGVLTVNEP